MKEVSEGKCRTGVDFLTSIWMFIIFILSYPQGRTIDIVKLRASESLRPQWKPHTAAAPLHTCGHTSCNLASPSSICSLKSVSEQGSWLPQRTFLNWFLQRFFFVCFCFFGSYRVWNETCLFLNLRLIIPTQEGKPLLLKQPAVL